jgi:hypothetical protein
MKPSELPGTRSLYRLTNRALIKIRELWQYAGEDELPPDSLLQAQVEALRTLHRSAALGQSAVPALLLRTFPRPCRYPPPPRYRSALGSPLYQPHALSAAVRFGGLGRRYILVVFDDRPVGLLSHADGSGLFPEARSKLIALSWEEIRLALMLDIGSN